MTVIAHYPNGRKRYRCDACGAEDFWQTSWVRITSMALDEACPDEVPAACCEACRRELKARIADGRIALPKLALTPGGFDVAVPRRGY